MFDADFKLRRESDASDGRLFLGFPQKVFERWTWLSHHEYLICEQPLRQMDQRLIETKQKPSQPTIAHRQRKWSWYSVNFHDAESALLEESAHRAKREQPRVGHIENAPLAIIELTEQEHDPNYEESDVSGADDNLEIRQ